MRNAILFLVSIVFSVQSYSQIELVADINPDSLNSYPNDCFDRGDTLYFTATDSTHNRGLFSSMGTTVSTKQLIGGGLIYKGDWGVTYSRNLDKLFFNHFDGISYFLCSYDFATKRIDSLLEDGARLEVANVGSGIVIGSSTKRKVWGSNGVPGDTILLFTDGGVSVSIHDRKSDPTKRLMLRGSPIQELWCTDGTVGGTYLLYDFSSAGYEFSGSNVIFEYDSGRYALTLKRTTWDHELWSTDFSPSGTRRLADLGKFHVVVDFRFKGHFYFSQWRTGGYGMELHRLDTAGGIPELVMRTNPEKYGSFPQDFTDMDSAFVFSAVGKDLGRELWISKGDSVSSRVLLDINPDTNTDGCQTYNKNVFDGHYYFVGKPNDRPAQLWISNGTDTGTIEVDDFNDNPYKIGKNAGTVAEPLHEFKGYLYLSAYSEDHGVELCRMKLPFVYPTGSATGVKEMDGIVSAYRISPNPGNDRILISADKAFNLVEVYDLNGRLIRSSRLSDQKMEEEIEMTGMVQGIYLIRVYGANWTEGKKWIKLD